MIFEIVLGYIILGNLLPETRYRRLNRQCHDNVVTAEAGNYNCRDGVHIYVQYHLLFFPYVYALFAYRLLVLNFGYVRGCSAKSYRCIVTYSYAET
jgi:hypothetical protein